MSGYGFSHFVVWQMKTSIFFFIKKKKLAWWLTTSKVQNHNCIITLRSTDISFRVHIWSAILVLYSCHTDIIQAVLCYNSSKIARITVLYLCPCFLACMNMFSAVRFFIFIFFNWLGYFSEETKFATWWFFDFYLYRVLYIPCWMKRTKQWSRGKNLQSMLKMNRKYPFFNPNSSVTRIVASWLQQEKDFRYFIPFLIELCIAIIKKNAELIFITELISSGSRNFSQGVS